IGVLKNLVNKTDVLVIGGAMTYTFLKALGKPVGKSLVEDDYLETAKEIMKNAEESNCHLLLPVDHIVASNFEDTSGEVVDEIPEGKSGFDIGPKSLEKIKD